MPNAEFVIEIHYGPGGVGLTDSTKLNLQFIDNPSDIRQVKARWLLNDSPPILLDGPLVIPANEVVTFHQQSLPLPEPISVISIAPHMHFLGGSYEVWFEAPDGELVPLINIPHWDFHWQKYYTFQKVQPIPAGSVIKSIGTYDNTPNNHDNPNSPPITVYRGLKTTDEMFLCFFTFTDYQPGDEDIIMDSTLIQSTSVKPVPVEKNWTIYPNPSQDLLELKGRLSRENELTFKVLSFDGKVVFRQEESKVQDFWHVQFDISGLEFGTYFIEWRDENGIHYARFNKI